MSKRIYLKELRITGPGKPDASLEFALGLNVIDGASNTGKSYAFQCLDYMFGATNIPEQIDEATGYTDIYLEIQTWDGSPRTFKRQLQVASDFIMSAGTIDEFATKGEKFQLKRKHEANSKKTLSNTLLELIDLSGKEVKKNERNTTRSLSFRDIASIISVNEVKIIAKESPIYSGQKIDETVEKSVFSLLLTGNDASALIEIEETKMRKGRINGQIAFIDKLIKDYEGKIKSLNTTKPKEEAVHIETRIGEFSSILSELSKEQEILTKKRLELWEIVEKYKSRVLMIGELRGRFELLQKHYESDLKRLEFITTGEELVNQLQTVNCPICGNDLDKDHFDCNIQSDESIEVRRAIDAEISKIQLKVADLSGTLGNLETEMVKVEHEKSIVEQELDKLNIKIIQELEPRKAQTKKALETLLQQQKTILEYKNLEARIAELWVERSKLTQELKTKQVPEDKSTTVEYSIYKEFCLFVANDLKNWNFSENPRVDFDEDKMDIVIDGKARSSNGKGYRGIAHAAFIVGIMDYCYDKQLNHPGVVIIDSPLTAYQKADYTKEDELTPDIESAFFQSLSMISIDRQIIVLDNKSPDDQVKARIKYIHFTKVKGTGRYGFFPI
jgi:hypothetical protein